MSLNNSFQVMSHMKVELSFKPKQPGSRVLIMKVYYIQQVSAFVS